MNKTQKKILETMVDDLTPIRERLELLIDELPRENPHVDALFNIDSMLSAARNQLETIARIERDKVRRQAEQKALAAANRIAAAAGIIRPGEGPQG